MIKAKILLFLLLCYMWNITVCAQSLVQALRQTDADVFPMIAGRMDTIGNAFIFVGSTTLIRDTGLNIVVDTPSATDISGKMQMLAALKYKNLSPAQIDMVITTHGHPDHFGQVGSFPNAQHFFNNFVYTGNKFTKSEFTGGEIQITPNVKLWQTPGHTPQDVSAIVSNVPVKGTVAIVGDLILSANDLLDSHEWEQSAWNVQIGLKNRNKVVCAANHIVPGHGRPFIVTQQMKNLAQCESVGNPNTGSNNIGSVTATVATGRMKLYPGSSSPLRCFSNSECLQFPGFTNCAHSIRFDTLVCCSTTSCP